MLHDSTDCYIQANGRMVGAVGVNNLIIIDTPDALLVAHKSRAQDVKHIYAGLKAQGHESHKLHRTVHRPWGTYTVLEEDPGYKIKRIEVKPGASLSLQMHHHRSEHWIVVTGTAEVVNGDQTIRLEANQSTYIPAGIVHRLANPGKVALHLIEVQCGPYLGEDDIIRIEDEYGRLPSAEEREWAASSGEGREYPWGSEEPGARACWNGEGSDAGKGNRNTTCAVGSKLVRPCGLARSRRGSSAPA